MEPLDIEEGMHFSEPVSIRSLTIDFFMEHAAEARKQGLTHWGTQTEKSGDPWTTILVFFKPEVN